jgi:hypothetical protein
MTLKRAVAINGVPCSGKSTLVRNFLEGLSDYNRFKKGLIEGRVYPHEQVCVIGKYDDDHDLDGTDRLSRVIYQDFENFLTDFDDCEFVESGSDWTVLYEGCRMFSERHIQALKDGPEDYRILILEISEEAMKERRDSSERDLDKGKSVDNYITGVRKLKRRFDLRENLEVLPNEDESDFEENISYLSDLCLNI